MEYIKVPRVFEKLKKAEDLYSPVIMTAANGWGKSAAVEYYYRHKKTITLHCKDGKLTEMPEQKSIRVNVVIIEDMQGMTDEESIRYLKELLRESGRQVIMLTRSTVPKYLIGEDMDLGFIRIQEADFAFGEKEVAEYFRMREVELYPDDLEVVTEKSHGYPYALYFCATRMEGGRRFTKEIGAAVWQDIFHMWDGHLFERWPEEFVNLAMSVCRYDSFTVEMAVRLTGNKNVSQTIEYCRENMNQLEYKANGSYSIRPEMRAYYCWKQELIRTPAAIRENYCRAADYFESVGDIANALKYYKKAGATQRLKELLVRNAHSHPGTGHFVETREYYFELPKEEVCSVPVLMAGMSMLYDLILQPERSEEWYAELVAFERDRRQPKEMRKESRAWLAYLDIALPHRGTKGILRIMRDVFSLMRKGDVTLPELSATGNLPSVMNGGLDFCEWSKSDTQIARFMGKPVEVITGKYGNGMVTMALAESGFEKGTMSAYEVMTRLGDGYEAASHGGKIEMCFVSVGIQVRQHLIEGQLPSAIRIRDSFREKVMAEKAEQLLPNLEAFSVWLSLFEGGGENVRDYIDSVTDVRVFFNILDRYRQMIKLRCLIAENRLVEALDLANFLTGYFTSYSRYFYWMENELLKGVILYRAGDDHYRRHVHAALLKAAEYHFVRLISIEGAAILPVLEEMKKDGELEDIPEKFFAQAYEECRNVSMFYPDYLKYIPKETVEFTERERQVLSMLCAGMTMEEMCSELDITYSGLKKHNRNIYKKLGAKDRAEAERKALQAGLVHRGN